MFPFSHKVFKSYLLMIASENVCRWERVKIQNIMSSYPFNIQLSWHERLYMNFLFIFFQVYTITELPSRAQISFLIRPCNIWFVNKFMRVFILCHFMPKLHQWRYFKNDTHFSDVTFVFNDWQPFYDIQNFAACRDIRSRRLLKTFWRIENLASSVFNSI